MTQAAPDEQPHDGGGSAATDAAERRRPFSTFLAEQRNGGLLAELTEKLSDIVTGVVEYEKTGELTLKLKVKHGDGGTVVVTDTVTTKVPEADRPASLFFPDDRGNLSRRDPRQAELPLREVTGKPAAPKEIN